MSIRRTRRPRTAVLLWALAAVIGLAGAGIAAARATDSPDFCRSACHEMEPFVDAWALGPHAGIGCVECHVEPGMRARLEHKVTALGEVRSHFFGDPVFPASTPADVPDERCVRCHGSLRVTTPGFDHDQHAERGPCQSCHISVGHRVSRDALQAAGVLNGAPPASRAESSVAQVDRGSANVPGHTEVTCTRCHDMQRTGCGSCHAPKHDAAKPARKTDPCLTCHTAGAAFAFDHPSRTDCSSCHATPAAQHDYAEACTSCHPATGRSWAFRHPAAPACAQCHTRPPGHRSGECGSCHRQAGTSWAFRHPSSGTCTSCHNRPSGHSTKTCSSCHRAGASWAFRHPSGSCSSCHSAPARHYGSGCASCHSPSRSWTSASFSHPRISGGEHSYRSFACGSCHPSGYGSASCAKCHNGSPDGDDDDDD